MSRLRSRKKFRKSFLILLIAYLVLIPFVIYLLDAERFLRWIKYETGYFITGVICIAASIAFIISWWSGKDSQLRRW